MEKKNADWQKRVKEHWRKKMEDVGAWKMVGFPGCKGCKYAADDGLGTGYNNDMCQKFDLYEGKPLGLSEGEVTCKFYTK